MLSKSCLGQSPVEFAEAGLATICGECWDSLEQNSHNCSEALKILRGVYVYSCPVQSLLSGPDVSRLSLFWHVSLLLCLAKDPKTFKKRNISLAGPKRLKTWSVLFISPVMLPGIALLGGWVQEKLKDSSHSYTITSILCVLSFLEAKLRNPNIFSVSEMKVEIWKKNPLFVFLCVQTYSDSKDEMLMQSK